MASFQKMLIFFFLKTEGRALGISVYLSCYSEKVIVILPFVTPARDISESIDTDI